MTWPPGAPGTAPRISSRLRAASISTTRRFSMVRRTHPCGPTCACPGTRGPASGAGRSSPARGAPPRRRARPCRPRNCGASSCRQSPCRWSCRSRRPSGPALKRSTLSSAPGARSAPSPSARRNSTSELPGLDLGLAVVAGQRPADAEGLRLPNGDLHCAIAVGFRRLDLGDAVRQSLDHRHRDRLAGVRKDARHAALAANETDRHRYVLVHRPGCDWPGLKPPVIAIAGPAGKKTVLPAHEPTLAGRQGALVEGRLERCGIGGPPAPLERYPQSGPGLGEKEPRIIAIRPGPAS